MRRLTGSVSRTIFWLSAVLVAALPIRAQPQGPYTAQYVKSQVMEYNGCNGSSGLSSGISPITGTNSAPGGPGLPVLSESTALAVSPAAFSYTCNAAQVSSFTVNLTLQQSSIPGTLSSDFLSFTPSAPGTPWLTANTSFNVPQVPGVSGGVTATITSYVS